MKSFKSIKYGKHIANPKMSIITVTYNSDKTIEATINSVISQNYNSMEYIIIDGNSSDNTIDIIKKYENRIHKWVSEPDAGIYDAMNKGIELSSGQYLLFINSGDLLRPSIIEQISKIFNETYLLIYGNVYHKSENRIYFGEYNSKRLSYRNIPHQAIFYHRELFNTLGNYSLQYRVCADYAFNLQCFSYLKNSQIRYLDKIISDYEGGGFSSYSTDVGFFTDKQNIISVYLDGKHSKFYQEGVKFFDILQYMDRQKFILVGEESNEKLVIVKRIINQFNSKRKTNNRIIKTINIETLNIPLPPEESGTIWYIHIDKEEFEKNVNDDHHVLFKPFIITHKLINLLERNKNLHLIIFGTGKAAEYITFLVQKYNYNNHTIKLYFDNHYDSSNKVFMTKPVAIPQKNLVEEELIIIASQWQHEIYTQLIDMDINSENIVKSLY